MPQCAFSNSSSPTSATRNADLYGRIGIYGGRPASSRTARVTCLSDKEAAALAKEYFLGVQGNELKHKNLSRRPAGQSRIVNFVNAVRGTDKFTIWLCHKEFLLLTYLVDLWVEPSMYKHGIELYRDDGNVALSNMTYYYLKTFADDRFLRGHLERFQKMMRYRTPQNFRTFFAGLYRDYLKCDKETQDI